MMHNAKKETIKNPNCRTGCPTQDHESYADCCKGLQFNLAHLRKSRAQESNR